MDELNCDLVEQWLAQGCKLAEEFELGLWEGAYPSEQIETVVQLFELANQQPFGDLEIEEQPRLLSSCASHNRCSLRVATSAGCTM